MKLLLTGHRRYQVGDKTAALMAFTRLAAIGVEIAQYNAAFILAEEVCPTWSTLPLNFKNNSNRDITDSETQKRIHNILHLQSYQITNSDINSSGRLIESDASILNELIETTINGDIDSSSVTLQILNNSKGDQPQISLGMGLDSIDWPIITTDDISNKMSILQARNNECDMRSYLFFWNNCNLILLYSDHCQCLR